MDHVVDLFIISQKTNEIISESMSKLKNYITEFKKLYHNYSLEKATTLQQKLLTNFKTIENPFLELHFKTLQNKLKDCVELLIKINFQREN